MASNKLRDNIDDCVGFVTYRAVLATVTKPIWNQADKPTWELVKKATMSRRLRRLRRCFHIMQLKLDEYDYR